MQVKKTATLFKIKLVLCKNILMHQKKACDKVFKKT